MIAAVADIDLGALRANFAWARQRAGGKDVIAVVKADAYGHGAPEVARALRGEGCPALAIWSVEEAVRLRDAGDAGRLLVLRGVLDPEEAHAAAVHGLEAVIHDSAGRQRLVEAAKAGGAPLSVHVEVDTGMRRMGLPPESAAAFISETRGTPGLELAGVFTHLARADEPDPGPSLEQCRAFSSVLEALKQEGVAPGSIHILNSAGLAALPELSSQNPVRDAVRPGLLLYGAQPSATRSLPLRPVMSLRAPVVALRRVRCGDAVGYAAQYRAQRDTRIATLGLGYADGVPVHASGRGGVWLAGERRPFAGRVSMDYLAVEVGDAAVSVGDEAVLFGSEAPGGPAVLPVEDAAAAAETLSYEMLVRVSARVRRRFHGV